MNDELRKAAERLLRDLDETFHWPGQLPYNSTPDLQLVCGRIIGDYPVDDDEPVTEEWLSREFGPHLPSGIHKRYSLCFAIKHNTDFNWCPPCGNLAQCVCIGTQVIIESPARGDMRRLCRAMGIPW